MTTIAYKDGMVACDSRLTRGAVILTDDYPGKMVKIDNRTMFWFSGDMRDWRRLASKFPSENVETPPFEALVFREPGIFLYQKSDENDFCQVIAWSADKHIAIGSGCEFATTAMDFGASAQEAVRYAATRDSSTGGTVFCTNILSEPPETLVDE